MIKQPFGKTGFEVSPLGFGSAPVGILQTDRDRAGRVMNMLLDSGVNLIDTAAGYAGAEELIAETIGHRREQFVLVSKCGNKVDEIPHEPWTPELIAKTVDRSLRRLKTDVLDVMLLHSCSYDVLRQGDALAALVKARQQGKIRFAGYSGDNEAAAYAATLPDVAVIQTSINICDQINIDRVLPHCRQQNIGVMAKRPIANAAWKQIEQQPGFYKSYAKTYTDRLAQMNIMPKDVGFDGDWSELALRFTLSQPGVHVAIIGTTNPDNAATNIAHAQKGPLPTSVVRALREAFRKADPTGAWTGQQ